LDVCYRQVRLQFVTGLHHGNNLERVTGEEGDEVVWVSTICLARKNMRTVNR
jgi:hypothetical protein